MLSTLGLIFLSPVRTSLVAGILSLAGVTAYQPALPPLTASVNGTAPEATSFLPWRGWKTNDNNGIGFVMTVALSRRNPNFQ